MALIPGTRLGPYEVTAQIGAGGMGEVYKARDTRLDRTVAIKVLPEHVASDPELKQRFEREAKTLATLSHPHICSVFDVGQKDGIDFLVMEYLEGEALAERLTKRALPLDQALTCAIEIADALDKAHRQGIVHRDLKPGNIMLTKSGAKLLDFGLAKLKAGAAPASLAALSALPTQDSPMTAQGTILGTLQYMAPEQLEGQEADTRTDTFAFGAVLYEMVTGRKAFEGKSQASLISAILKDDPPPLTTLQPVSPPALDRVVKKCLAKDPDRRWHSAHDLHDELQWIADIASRADVPTSSQARQQAARWRPSVLQSVSAGLGAVVLAGLAVWSLMRPAPERLARFVISTGGIENVYIAPNSGDVAISADGQHVAYFTGNLQAPQIQMRALDQLVPTTLVYEGQPFGPFFSPDSQWLGFYDLSDLLMKKVSVHGGPTLEICKLPDNAQMRGATWGADDTIVFATSAPDSGLWRVHAGGGEPVRLTTPDKRGDHLWPEMLPGGQAVLFTVISSGDPGDAQLAVVSLEGGAPKLLNLGGSQPRYVPTGYLLYGIDGTLRAVRFDPGRLEVESDPIPVVNGVITKASGAANFSVSRDGSLVYIAGARAGVGAQTLLWVDRKGREEPLNAPPRAYRSARLSPDGTRVALDDLNDIWIWHLAGKTLARLTSDPGLNRAPVWTPDGTRLAFRSARDGRIYWQAADGSGTAEQLSDGSIDGFPASFTPDGTRLAFTKPRLLPFDMGVITVSGERQAEMLLETPSTEMNAEISPDGRWLAYESDESRQSEIYVRPFPDVKTSVRQVSIGGGSRPLWSRDGSELFYHVAPNTIMAVPLQPGERLTWGRPEVVVQGPYTRDGNGEGRHYDVSRDGQRFLLLREAGDAGTDAAPPEIIVVLNWQEELKARVPTK